GPGHDREERPPGPQGREGHRPVDSGDRGRQRRQDADRRLGRDLVCETLRAPARPAQRRVDHPALPSFLPAPQRFTRYTSCFWPGTRSITPRASKSSFVPSMYQGIEPSNFPLSFVSTATVSRSCVRSPFPSTSRIVFFIVSYFVRLMLTPLFP